MPNFVPMSRLAIAIGNTHIKLGLFAGQKLHQVWQVRVDQPDQLESLARELSDLPCAIASVNPRVTTPWHYGAHTWLLDLTDIPLANTYPSLGLDRAVVGWAGGQIYGCPALIIDLGTAISLTGLDQTGSFGGGAILPGLRSQFSLLHQSTAGLPLVTEVIDQVDPWGKSTLAAMQSGVIWGTAAALGQYVQAWQQLVGLGSVVITGGDRSVMYAQLNHMFPQYQAWLKCDSDLILTGINLLDLCRNKKNKADC